MNDNEYHWQMHTDHMTKYNSEMTSFQMINVTCLKTILNKPHEVMLI